ncbi:hypothetical protein Vi05172_g11064 [Venturia inaequalis]|nr:hypothetical protein Vi05172_g11064 [Venturia inaequalis]
MKRSKPAADSNPPSKRRRIEVPEYCSVDCIKDEDGSEIWPAPAEQMKMARNMITECANENQKTVIVPDKDTDGLTSGAILFRTLVLLGLDPDLIEIHLVEKGTSITDESERKRIALKNPKWIFVLDQGSRNSPPIIETSHKALVIDHHFATAEDHPEGAAFINACNFPPVATSALLTYALCAPLHSDVPTQCDWLCVMGTHGDLGTALKWNSPFPDMQGTMKKYTKKAINDAVARINAPRRTSTYDVKSAWDALIDAKEPKDILTNTRLLAARDEVASEVERCTHTAPKFSYDGKIAVFRISSAAQIHPVIATRWAGHLQSPKLEFILVANEGYLEDKVNFSCRIPRCARNRETPVNIIESLREIAAASPTRTLTERLGESFARGHKEASGGIVGKAEFEELMTCLRVGEKPPKMSKDKKESPTKQSNTLMNYFGKK